MKNNSTILLFCNFELPDSCANATRIFSFAKLLKSIGCSIKIWGVTYNINKIGDGESKGFSYSNIYCPELHGLKALKRKKIIEKKIHDLLNIEENSIDAVLLSNVYFDLAKPFIKFSKNTGTPLIVNEVEWYNHNSDLFSGLTGKLRFIQNRYALRKIHVKMKNIIAISTLLGDYYKDKGCNVCVIPTIIDSDDYKNLGHIVNSKLQIAYAGNPSKKDYVANVINAISLLTDEERSRIMMHFYGITKSDAKNIGIEEAKLEKLTECVLFHGIVSQKQVKEKIAAADFTVLLRPNKRYANAGFPTKVGESMACGTPIIANITSDLGKYIINENTGIICDDESTKSCLKAIKKALSLSGEKKATLRYNALEMAKISFDYRNYIETIKNFLNNI